MEEGNSNQPTRKCDEFFPKLKKDIEDSIDAIKKQPRKSIYEIIEEAGEKSELNMFSKWYDIFMTVVILASIIPLAFTKEYKFVNMLEWVATGIFIIDYLLRWFTADYKLENGKWLFWKTKKNKWTFCIYPFTAWAIIDILSILPSFYLLDKSFRVIRATRFLRLFRLLKTLRYYKDGYLKGFTFFWKGMKAAKQDMIASLEVLFALTLVLAFLLFLVEHPAQPEVYGNYWDSLVWSFMSYLGNPGKFSPGDPVTNVGRTLWIIIAIVKIALFAVPAGLIANGFREAMAKDKKANKDKKNAEKIRNTFYIHSIPLFDYPFFPQRFEEFNVLKSRFSLTEEEIFAAVNSAPDLRTRAYKGDFCVELFHANRNYGFNSKYPNEDFPEIKSNVTILSHTNAFIRNLSFYSYQLARLGKFNLITNEYLSSSEDEVENRCTILGITDTQYYDEVNYPKLHEFVSDVKSMINGNDDWAIVLRWKSDKELSEKQAIGLHINVEDEKIDNTLDNCTTVNDTSKLKAFYEDLQKTMLEKQGIETYIKYEKQYKTRFCNYVRNFIGKQPNVIEIHLSKDYLMEGKGAKNLRDSIKVLEEVIHRNFETINTEWNTENWGQPDAVKYASKLIPTRKGGEYGWNRIMEIIGADGSDSVVKVDTFKKQDYQLKVGDEVRIVNDRIVNDNVCLESKVTYVEVIDDDNRIMKLEGVTPNQLEVHMCITNNKNLRNR